MELDGARVLVAGATGELGRRLVAALSARGARVAAAGRDPGRLAALGTTGPDTAGPDTAPGPLVFDARDPASCRRVVRDAAEALGGLDAVVVTVGVAAFGPAESLDDEVAEELFAVNVLGPIALISESLGLLGDGGTVVALSAVVADFPTADMAAYSASKAALSAFLAAVRRERRRQHTHVLDVRPQHMETGFSDRSLAGDPPALPDGADPDELVRVLVDALPTARREIAYDVRAGTLQVR